MLKLKNNVSKIRDDLKKSEEKFNVESYLTANEAGKYLSDLPGLKDIISAVSGVIDKIAGFADMILGFLEKILSWLDLNKILDALGIKQLVEFIVNLVSSGLTAIGFPIGIRSMLTDLFNTLCIPMSNLGDNYDRNILERFSLLSLILSLACTIGGSAYSNMHTIMMNTPDITNTKSSILELNLDIELLTNSPLMTYDATIGEHVTNQTLTDAKIAEMNLKLTKLTDRLSVLENKVDDLFAFLGPLVFTQMAVSNKASTPQTTFALATDISTHSTGSIIKQQTNGLAHTILAAIDNSTKGKEKESELKQVSDVVANSDKIQPITSITEYGPRTLIYGNTELMNKFIPPELECGVQRVSNEVTNLESMSVDKVIQVLTALDSNVTLVGILESKTLPALARREFMNSYLPITELNASTPIPISDKLKYLV